MKFSKLSDLDKKELLNEIRNMKLVYRYKLYFSSNIKFGIEIEYGNAKKDNIKKALSDLSGEGLEYETYYRWQYTYDCNFATGRNNEYYGGEISSPIFKNKREYFRQIKNVCEILKDNNAIINEKMGFHIHVSEDTLKYKLEYLENLLKIYMLYEDIIFKFGFYGKKPRTAIYKFSIPSSYIIYRILKNKEYSSYEELDNLLYNFLNKSNSITKGEYKDTFEFRNCNPTINPIIIQNNINLFCSLMECSKSKYIDIDKIDYDLKKFRLSSYSNIPSSKDINRAFELVDIVFKNDIDKKYFLKQFIMK